MTIKIMTNNKPRLIKYGYELSEKQKEDFDYIAPCDIDSHDFVEYKGNIYDIGEFMRVAEGSEYFQGWHGYTSDSFFSGTLMRYCEDTDYVVMGWFYQ